jgi:hypothetical protein
MYRQTGRSSLQTGRWSKNLKWFHKADFLHDQIKNHKHPIMKREIRIRAKFRVRSARLASWDYANDGAYFITICTKNRRNYFGDVVEDKMVYTPMGVIADVMWLELKNHFPALKMGKHVVMQFRNRLHDGMQIQHRTTNVT